MSLGLGDVEEVRALVEPERLHHALRDGPALDDLILRLVPLFGHPEIDRRSRHVLHLGAQGTWRSGIVLNGADGFVDLRLSKRVEDRRDQDDARRPQDHPFALTQKAEDCSRVEGLDEFGGG